MSEQDDTHKAKPQKPARDDLDAFAWSKYWKKQGQPWRIEAEIDDERQKFLAERRKIGPHFNGIYPFKDIKLTRADVEWLLATHEDGRGPVDWNDESQRERKGLDLRGADLRDVYLSHLPLARTIGSLLWDEYLRYNDEHYEAAAIHLEQAVLMSTHLEGAALGFAHLEGASLGFAYLDRACLTEAYLEKANLHSAHLEHSDLTKAHLQDTNLNGTYFEGADLSDAHLERADLSNSHFEQAQLKGAHLEGAYLSETHFEGANLREVFFTTETQLINIFLGDKGFGFALLADVRWGDTNLAVVNWGVVKKLGDESEAERRKRDDEPNQLLWYRRAMRANRQLAVALRNQGLNEEADHFAYRAQILQRKVWRLQGKPLKFLLSWFLYMLAGYGYRPLRSLISYLIIIFVFMGLYLLNAHFVAPHLRWDEALVLSISSFHGRGFFTQNVTLGDTYARLAATEAIIGLFIEISFIATFTQRFFGR